MTPPWAQLPGRRSSGIFAETAASAAFLAMSRTTSSPSVPSVGFVSLGCAKNLVDLQVMAGRIVRAGLRLAPSAEKADVILVNTCAFIESAREEAAENILWACDRKKKGKCRAVVVAGCLPQRYADRMAEAFPDVDAILGVDDIGRAGEGVVAAVGDGKTRVQSSKLKAQISDSQGQISDFESRSSDSEGRSSESSVRKSASKARGAKSGKLVDAVTRGKPHRVFDPDEPGLVLSGGPFAYLKIAEGCFHACAFCAIPGIRGRFRSRPVEAIVAGARALVADGYRELDLVAQDVTAYGRDIPSDRPSLVDLLRALDGIPGDFRIRLLYGYPATVTDELLRWMAESPHACRYLDIPVQHSHPDVLRAMRRSETIDAVASLAERARRLVPGITLRTTLLVGFPGETEEHFRHLLNYVRTSEFDHLGVFAFSPEEGTPAYDMGDEPDAETAERRRDEVLRLQQDISRLRLAALVGRDDVVLLEAPSPENGKGVWIGRSSAQAPDDIDGVTYVFRVPGSAQPGALLPVRYTGSDEYDLVAEAR